MVFLFSNSFSSFFFIFLIPLISSSSSSDGPQNFIVHVAKSQKPLLFSSHHHWYISIIESLPPSPSHSSKLLYSYDKAIHGFSASLTPTQADKLRDIPGILSVIPDRTHELHTTHTPHFLGLDHSQGLWPNSDYADDVIIGVLDTGIWPGHPSFSDAGLSPVPSSWKGKCDVSKDFPASSCNRKLIGARAFSRGYVAHGKSPIDESNDSISPRDTKGHGTHTASTAAGAMVKNASLYNYAYGEARGMATKARIAAYKVCWSSCMDSDLLAGLDQAISDGVHVISLSAGPSAAFAYDSDPIAIGSFGAVRHGLVVSCSVGNKGPGSSTATNIAPWLLTVGASTVDREFSADVVLGDGRVFHGASLYSGDTLNDTQFPLIYAGDRYCKSLQSNVKGKIVLCDRGVVSRVAKGKVVKEAGGVGMIMANLKTSGGEELIADPHLLPATTVGGIAGDKIREYIRNKKNPTATITFKGTVIGPTPASPKVAAFSSRGPNSVTPEILKPDVVAPGVNILAGWTGLNSPSTLSIDTRRVEFNVQSGSSMACPHVSGIAAMLRKAYPNWSPAAIKSAIMTTTYNLDNSGKTFEDLATGNQSTPFAYGAGHVDPNKALNPGLVYDLNADDYLAFLCSIGYSSDRIATVLGESVSSDICTKTAGISGNLTSAGDLNYPSFSVVFNYDQDPVTHKRVVKNVGSKSDAVYKVKVSAPSGVEINVVPEKLVFSAEKPTQAYEITFSATGVNNGGLEKFGWIEWSDESHRVRSPVAVRWKIGGSVASV